MHIYASVNCGCHWSVAYSTPIHQLSPCWLIINDTHKLKILYNNSFKMRMLSFIGLITHMRHSVNWVDIGPGNSLAPVQRQAKTRTDADLSSTTFQWRTIRNSNVPFTQFKMVSANWWPFCAGHHISRKSPSNNELVPPNKYVCRHMASLC